MTGSHDSPRLGRSPSLLVAVNYHILGTIFWIPSYGTQSLNIPVLPRFSSPSRNVSMGVYTENMFCGRNPPMCATVERLITSVIYHTWGRSSFHALKCISHTDSHKWMDDFSMHTIFWPWHGCEWLNPTLRFFWYRCPPWWRAAWMAWPEKIEGKCHAVAFWWCDAWFMMLITHLIYICKDHVLLDGLIPLSDR